MKALALSGELGVRYCPVTCPEWKVPLRHTILCNGTASRITGLDASDHPRLLGVHLAEA